ncbi:hypothetical protein NLG97_g9473 [Lecanicillium saksenae]|uniref:Uncharacterized protein n=1 Tax=Lecanicillium saksenae TaxID=468837 RepID=A0ACC1QJU8_9HYPO|nr:hypothetical protein NLG97_g9473 [Lecanicillium saksenae]
MKIYRFLVVSCLASVSHVWGLDVERPNPDHPGTRDLFITDFENAQPMRQAFIAVPNAISLEQVYSIGILGEPTPFTNGESWIVVGDRRVLQFNAGLDYDAKDFEMGFDPADYPVVTPGEELNALMEQLMPLEELREKVADMQRYIKENQPTYTTKVPEYGCAACQYADPVETHHLYEL